MKNLIIPPKLNEGDTVAFISISGGRAGDADMIPRYMLGKRRFEKIFDIQLSKHPKATIHGKEAKTRSIPLRDDVVRRLKQYLALFHP